MVPVQLTILPNQRQWCRENNIPLSPLLRDTIEEKMKSNPDYKAKELAKSLIEYKDKVLVTSKEIEQLTGMSSDAYLESVQKELNDPNIKNYQKCLDFLKTTRQDLHQSILGDDNGKLSVVANWLEDNSERFGIFESKMIALEKLRGYVKSEMVE